MKTVLVSMRTDLIAERNESRDSLDPRLIDFLRVCGLNALPIPNRLSSAQDIFSAVQPEGVIFSGGSDHSTRQEVEEFLAGKALETELPIFGICHGMQFLVKHFGGEVAPIREHVAQNHLLFDSKKDRWREVNSFHELGIFRLPLGWRSLAHANDESIEWTSAPAQKIQAIMWHPERDAIFSSEDITIFREHFKT